MAFSTFRPLSRSCARPCQRSTAALKPAVVCRVAKAEEAVAAVASSNGARSVTDAPSNMLDFEELSDIIRMVHDTDIVEFELKSKRFSLSVKKKEALEQKVQVVHAAAPAQVAAAPVAAPMAVAPAAAPAPPAAPAAPAAPASPPPPKAVEGVEITSPMSGTFYSSPAPGEPSFVKVGDRVTKGQVVCIIEAMKLMNEIEAEVSGTVVALLMDNGQPVAAGAPLMVIKP